MTRAFVSTLCLLIPLLLHVEPTFAGGNDILNQCTAAQRALNGDEDVNYSDAMFCVGLVQGVTSTLILTQLTGHALTCIPEDGIRTEQVVRIFIKYLSANPEQLHHNETYLVVHALQEAFPCPEFELLLPDIHPSKR